MQNVLRHAQQKDKAVNVILNKKITDQNKLSGNVSNNSDTSFILIDRKTGLTTTVVHTERS